MFMLFPPDVARWVLNKQITQTLCGGIVYKYDLIDDFDSRRCTFSGPIGFLTRYFPRRSVRDETDNVPLQVNTSTNSQYNKMNDSESCWVTQDDDNKPKVYEGYNHMLRIMVSGPHSCTSCVPLIRFTSIHVYIEWVASNF